MLAPRSRALLVLLVACAVAHGAYQVGRALMHTKQGLDFTPEYVAARMLADHGDLRVYDYEVVKARGREMGLHGPLGPDDPVVNYAYPPWLVVAYVPISRLPWEVARKVWFALSLAASFGAVALFAAACAPRREDMPLWATVAAAAACFYFPIPYGLMAGQANDLSLLGIAGCAWFLRQDRPFLAGLCLAPAGMWKIFTGFPALYLLARREWRALAGLTVGCAALVLASLPFVGVQTWIDWATYMRVHNTVGDVAPRDHGIAAAAMRLFQETSTARPLVVSPALVTATKAVLSLLACALAALALRRDHPRADPRRIAQIGATLVLAVLLTPKAWEHYGVYLLPCFIGCAAAAVAAIEVETTAPERKVGAFAALAVTGACFLVWGTYLVSREDFAALATSWIGPFAMSVKMVAGLLLLGVSSWIAGGGLQDER